MKKTNRKRAVAPGSAGSISYAICDGDRLLEESGTGKLAIYYSLDDAAFAFAAVRNGVDESMRANLRICEVEISKARKLSSQNNANEQRDERAGNNTKD